MGRVAENGCAQGSFINQIRRENAIEASEAERLHEQALGEARRLAAEMGKTDPTLRMVVLFGSAIPGREYRVDSDIDIAIIGGNRSLLERVAAHSSFRVDIIDIDDARPGIKESIMNEGLVLYAATES
jgi:predicted nucleotidyltransferase